MELLVQSCKVNKI